MRQRDVLEKSIQALILSPWVRKEAGNRNKKAHGMDSAAREGKGTMTLRPLCTLPLCTSLEGEDDRLDGQEPDHLERSPVGTVD